MHHLLVLTRTNARYIPLLVDQNLPELAIVDGDAEPQAAVRCDIFFGEPARIVPLLPAAQRLAWVQSSFAGIEALCAPGLRRDYLLTGVKGVFGPLISEYVLAYILALERNLFPARANQRQRAWRYLPYRRLRELTLGICGLGDIGRHLAATASHLGMRVVGYRRSFGPVANVQQVFSGLQLEAFLGQPDYLVLALPRTAGTDGLIDGAALRRMKTASVLINVGRGNAVNESDLAAALGHGHIRAAVLDVFDTEPLAPESPLWDLENCYITPHNAAKSVPEDLVPLFGENYRRWLAGEPLEGAIDFERGY